jgi:protein TonB
VTWENPGAKRVTTGYRAHYIPDRWPLAARTTGGDHVDFAHGQADPGRRYASFAAVAALHLVLGWMLTLGLARYVPDLLRQTPVELKVVKPEPPPPPPLRHQLLPEPSLAPPPPPRFIPPPEFEVTQQPETTVAASPIPHSLSGTGTETATPQRGSGTAGNGPGSGTPGNAPSRTPPQLDFSKCPLPRYPNIDEDGTTLVIFMMDVDGTIRDARVGKSSGPSVRHRWLDRVAVEFVQSCKGTPGTVNGRPVPLQGFTSIDWRLKY